MNIARRRWAAAAAVALAAAALAPRGAEARTVQLFPAHNVFASSSATAVFGVRSLVLICGANDVTSVASPGNPSGVIVDNFLTDTIGTNKTNLCTRGNSQLPPAGNSGNSCFSKVVTAGTPTPGASANQAYKGVGLIVLPNVPGTTLHTFRLEDAGVVGASNRLVLQTDCRVRLLPAGGGGGGSGGHPPSRR